MSNNFENLAAAIKSTPFLEFYGRVKSVRRDAIRTFIPQVKVGALCKVESSFGPIPMEIVSLDPDGHVAMPLNDLRGIQLGDRVSLIEESATISVGKSLLGQVVDSLCVPLSKKNELELHERVPLYGGINNPLHRSIISEPIDLGIRSINSCLSCGLGQRQGIFAGSGVGKSVLLGMMARYTSADVVVIALIGERGREVREFIERDLGEEGLKKSVVVVETADQSAVRRTRGAFVASSIAEYFRRSGANVLLLMDSLTRFAMASREIGIAAGEPPTTKGYTPSVFSSLSKLVERAGFWGDAGSITGLYTVLVEGDDLEDPVADAARAILDGHIVLSRKLANRGQFPAVELLFSISRCMDQIVDKEQILLARKLREFVSRFQDNEDAIQLGLYLRGTDSTIDDCIEKMPSIIEFLKQDRDERCTFQESKEKLSSLFT